MILILRQGTSREKVEELCTWLKDSYGIQTSPIFGQDTTIVGLVGDTSGIEIETLEQLDSVERVMKVQEPYKRANRKFHPDNSVIDVSGVKVANSVLLSPPARVLLNPKTRFV
jgi:3-deoxy-7-phosphoheptulonate synthase